MCDQKQMIEDLEEEVSDLINEIEGLTEELRITLLRAKDTYVEGYVEAGGDKVLAYRSWLQIAAERGFNV